MSDVAAHPRRYRTSTLWVIALAVIVADAAVWWLGSSLGLIGMGCAIAVIVATQRKVDAYWREHNAATNEQ